MSRPCGEQSRQRRRQQQHQLLLLLLLLAAAVTDALQWAPRARSPRPLSPLRSSGAGGGDERLTDISQFVNPQPTTPDELEMQLRAAFEEQRRRGMTDREILEETEFDNIEFPGGAAADVRKGSAAWGYWSQSPLALNFNVILPDEVGDPPRPVRGKDVVVDLCKLSNRLVIKLKGQEEPLMDGALKKAVVGSEIEWVIDEEDGNRLLCIQVPKKDKRDDAWSEIFGKFHVRGDGTWPRSADLD